MPSLRSRRKIRFIAAVGTIAGGLVLTAVPSADASQAAPVAGEGAHFVVVAPKPYVALDLAEEAVLANQGTVVRMLPEIGVIFARSQNKDFAAKVRKRTGVAGVGATRNLVGSGASGRVATRMGAPIIRPESASPPKVTGSAAADPLAANQWNMKLIGADKANEINTGSRNVLVGILDSGIDSDHPDLAANVDKGASVSCMEGIPNTAEASWQDEIGHGTHVAGIVAAARNGIGVAGVAPNVRVAAIKVGGAEGFIYPEAAICGYIWAAKHGVQVANTSLSIDPWYFWCSSNPDQKAVAEAIRRAISFSTRAGNMVAVSALGNENWDLAHDVVDKLSPNNGGPTQTRTADSSCKLLPAEDTEVVGVSSVGAFKSRYHRSNHGLGVADFSAPGGDAQFQTPATPDANGRVLSTLPGGQYGYFQGTSMASPHVAGVLALLKSRNPGMRANELVVALAAGTQVLPCPAGGVHDPDGKGTHRAVCEGGSTGAGFFGKGLINARKAVS
ncbi:S8 family peptidase [Amycolatopsis sp. cmx-11-51]|uniref:S8 family peptidase n=1 Tax=unclassified Amycolatopsis TaxID=2618356 RepID=UPI0039E362B8